MNRIIKFSYYYIRFLLRSHAVREGAGEKYFNVITKYSHRKVCSCSEMNEIIYDTIKYGNPFMAGRFGAVELSAIKTFDFEVRSRYLCNLDQMRLNAGFFPAEIALQKRFLSLMLKCIPEVDVLGVWGQPFEDYYLHTYGGNQLQITHLFNLEPWTCPEKPWSAALRGKSVLVIHPFADTVQKQYARRKELFPGTEILPEFDLKVFKAVQTIAGEEDDRFADWFEALEWMYQEVLKIEFDVAIIGCGAYGFPLAVKLKQAGKQAVHLGGATQLLFGIKGKRWEENPAFEYVRKFFNESWVYPSEAEKPQKASVVEGGCYW